MIRVLYESLFVGLYSCIVFYGSSIFLKNKNILLFVTGFFKHFLGYFFGIHSYYCKTGCRSNKYKDVKIDILEIIGQSILEGLLFLFLGNLIHIDYLGIFTIGVALHLVFEVCGIHKFFCKQYCLSS